MNIKFKIQKKLHDFFKRPVCENHPEIKNFGFECDYRILEELRKELEMREIILIHRSQYLQRARNQRLAETVLDNVVRDLSIPSAGTTYERQAAYSTLSDFVCVGMYNDKFQRKIGEYNVIPDGGYNSYRFLELDSNDDEGLANAI